MLAGVALLVRELAEQCVEADRAQPARAADLVSDHLHGLESDLKERKLAAVADGDRGLRGARVSCLHETVSRLGRRRPSPPRELGESCGGGSRRASRLRRGRICPGEG